MMELQIDFRIPFGNSRLMETTAALDASGAFSQVALALLGNTLPTGAMLVVLITILGPI
jgi:hypothetical protein